MLLVLPDTYGRAEHRVNVLRGRARVASHEVRWGSASMDLQAPDLLLFGCLGIRGTCKTCTSRPRTGMIELSCEGCFVH